MKLMDVFNPGTLCGDCKEEYGVTFDLRRCSNKDCSYGPALFVAICVITLVVSLAVLYFDFPLPNELKGVIFFAQVISPPYFSLYPLHRHAPANHR